MYTGPRGSDYSENLLVHFRRIESLKKEAIDFFSINLNKRQLCDLEMLLNRAFYPLDGYLGEKDYEKVLTDSRLADGTLWPLPICLDVSEAAAEGIRVGAPIALKDQEAFMLAVMQVDEIWRPDLKAEARAVFGTDDPSEHPGVRRFFAGTKPVYVSGKVEGLHLPQHYDFPELRRTPARFLRDSMEKGWRNVLCYLTDEYLHREHREMLTASCHDSGANLLIQSVVDPAMVGDPDHFSMVGCQREFLKTFPAGTAMLNLLPMAVRAAGPRQALLETIVQKNFGCSHYLIAEDHADPFAGTDRTYYPVNGALALVREHESELEISSCRLKRMIYVEDKAQYLPAEEVGPNETVRTLSSEELKRRLEFDLEIPSWFTFDEVADELRRAFPPRSKQGVTIFITGLSGAGKSTLAKVLFVKFMEIKERPVTLLDGDVVRRNLSSELKYTREHRNLNVTRIGFVAGEITKNGGIAICAPIAPYEESRAAVRELVSRFGGFVEIYMSTPLSVCEQRDRKGMYAKARAGLMQGVTGIDDPYVPPSNPELVIDTTNKSPTEAAQEVMLYLAEQSYLR
jgi:sulfate adenylyltransferase